MIEKLPMRKGRIYPITLFAFIFSIENWFVLAYNIKNSRSQPLENL